MVDPSLFTLPHDHFLCDALAHKGSDVTLFGRPLRRGEMHPGGAYCFRPDFYSWVEPIQGLRTTQSEKVLKGLQHFRDIVNFLRDVRREKYDVVHFQWLALTPVDLMALSLIKHPKVLSVHDHQPFLGAASSRVQTWGFNRIGRVFDRFIVHTEQAEGTLRRYGIEPGRIHRSRTADVLAQPTAGELAREPAKEILLFGTLKRYKGVDLLLKAFSLIPPERRQGWKVRIVGQPFPEVGDLHLLARDLGVSRDVVFDLRFVDHDEIPAIASGSAIHVYPYRDIDQSGVFTSFLQFGRPVVAMSVGLFREVLRDGENGLLVPKENEAELAKALCRLMNEKPLYERLSAAAKDLGRSMPNWEEIARDHMRVYERVLGRHS